MDTEIRRFIQVLQDNNCLPKSRLHEVTDNPDAVDGNEEIISETFDNLEDGNLPPFLTKFFINGISNRLDMEEFMAEEFKHFKVVVHAHTLWDNNFYKDYILKEAVKALKKLSDLKNSYSSYNDLDLNEIIKVKIKYCELTQELLQADLHGKTEPAEEHKKIESEEGAYVFRLKKEFSQQSLNNLKKLHKQLKDKKLIDSSLTGFQNLFVKYDDGIPSSAPKPIIWKYGTYNSLSYFIKRLSENKIIPDKGRPASGTFSNNHIALKLFYNQKEGQFFSPKKVQHDKDPSKTVKAIIDSAFERIEK